MNFTTILNPYLPLLAIVAGIVFFAKFPSIFRTAAANGLLAADKTTELGHAVRLGGIMLIGVGLVATVIFWL